MTTKDIKKFADSGSTDVTIIAIKDEGYVDDIYQLYLCGYIKELPGLIAQEDSWSEQKLIEQVENIYAGLVGMEKQKNGIILPKKLNYTVEYVQEEEWMNKT